MPILKLLRIEIINKKSKKILINTQYRRPARNFNEFEAYLNRFLVKYKATDKNAFYLEIKTLI